MKKQVTKIICDICGKDATGFFHMDMYVNDDYIDEFYCPLDLCKDCMKNYEFYLENHSGNAGKFMDSRGGSVLCSEVLKKELIRSLKRMKTLSYEIE